MSPTLFAHPFSSYCQKVLIALYENQTPFAYRLLDRSDVATMEEFEALWPIKRFPLLVDGQQTVAESTIIIEHLELNHPGPTPLIPHDREAALEVRFLDRCFDNYIHTPMQRIVSDSLRQEGERDPKGVEDARHMLDTAYEWLERRLPDRGWAAADQFGLADCAAAPALFYADWVHPISDAFAKVRAYRSRLLARPSVARAVDEARPYRSYFPLGAPDRD
jgi:glutathione S-transferase